MESTPQLLALRSAVKTGRVKALSLFLTKSDAITLQTLVHQEDKEPIDVAAYIFAHGTREMATYVQQRHRFYGTSLAAAILYLVQKGRRVRHLRYLLKTYEFEVTTDHALDILKAAAMRSNSQFLTVLLKDGRYTNHQDIPWSQLVYHSVFHGANVRIVKALLCSGPFLFRDHEEVDTLLRAAVRFNHKKVLTCLLKDPRIVPMLTDSMRVIMRFEKQRRRYGPHYNVQFTTL